MYPLAEIWTALDAESKAVYARKSVKDFQENADSQEQSAQKEVTKKKKPEAYSANGTQSMGEIKGRVMQILEDAELDVVTVRDARTKLARVCHKDFLKDNKAKITRIIKGVCSTLDKRWKAL